MIRIRVEAAASNMLPSILADLAEEAGYKIDATRARWDAVAEEDRAVSLYRTIELPAVPQPGDEIWIAPYSEAMVVRHMSWRAEPDPDDDNAQVILQVDDLDLDVVGDTKDALDAFAAAGWRVVPQEPF